MAQWLSEFSALQETRGQFPAPEWMLTTVSNYISTVSATFFSGLRFPTTCGTQRCVEVKHQYTQNKQMNSKQNVIYPILCQVLGLTHDSNSMYDGHATSLPLNHAICSGKNKFIL